MLIFYFTLDALKSEGTIRFEVEKFAEFVESTHLGHVKCSEQEEFIGGVDWELRLKIEKTNGDDSKWLACYVYNNIFPTGNLKKKMWRGEGRCQ